MTAERLAGDGSVSPTRTPTAAPIASEFPSDAHPLLTFIAGPAVLYTENVLLPNGRIVIKRTLVEENIQGNVISNSPRIESLEVGRADVEEALEAFEDIVSRLTSTEKIDYHKFPSGYHFVQDHIPRIQQGMEADLVNLYSVVTYRLGEIFESTRASSPH